jgi:hypothetical protein
MRKSIAVDMKVSGACPFCKGDFTAGHDENGVGVVLHSLPTCDRYDALTPDRYLHAVRTAFQGAS